jgi:hypothetical protein
MDAARQEPRPPMGGGIVLGMVREGEPPGEPPWVRTRLGGSLALPWGTAVFCEWCGRANLPVSRKKTA